MTVMTRPKSRTPGAPRPGGRSAAGKGPRGNSGQGSSSALAEMLRRQAQNPRPGAGQQQPPDEGEDGRRQRPTLPPRPGH